MTDKKNGKLIVVEGSDGCGKNTQSKLLVEALNKMGINSRLVTFPKYDSPSSGPVQMYLKGELGGVYDVTYKQASILYAVDRFCTFRSEGINKLLEDGWYIVCDRYVISNMIHQAAKHYGNDAAVELITDWISYLEYRELLLPEPDYVFFLDVKPEVSAKLKMSRLGNQETAKTGSVDRSKDIHESNDTFMVNSYLNGMNLAKRFNWTVIDCNMNDNTGDITIKPIESIHEDIISRICHEEFLDRI